MGMAAGALTPLSKAGVVLAYAQVRVMSYNTHYCVGMDGKKNCAAIAEVIKKADPDIVGLQEIADQTMAEKLERLTGMHVVFGESLPGYGDAILSKYPFEYLGNYSIPSASASRYQVMAALIDFSAKSQEIGKVRLINTHFDWLNTPGSRHARLATVDMIEEVYFKEPTVPTTILTGDLNSLPDRDVIRRLEKYGWINSSANGTYYTAPSVKPTSQIDYILYRAGSDWKVSKFQVMYGELSSDHLPVVADFEINK